MADRQELLGKLSASWGRQLADHPTSDGFFYCVYKEEALTGFAMIADPPLIGDFNGEKCVLVPLSAWIAIHTLASHTVTPFRLVAVGNSILVGAWRPHEGLKYAVRNTPAGACLHIPIKELKELT